MEWINLERAKKADVKKLVREFGLETSHGDSIISDSHRSRLFESDGYVALLFTHPSYNEVTGTVSTKELDVIVTKNRIATVHHGRFPLITKRFQEFADAKKKVSSAILLGEVLHILVTDVYDTLEEIAQKLDELEHHIFNNKKDLMQEVLNIQMSIIDIQKGIEGQELILDRLMAELPSSMSKVLEKRYEELRRHMAEIRSAIQTERQTAETLHGAHETYLNAKTNKWIKLLTALSLISLPAALMANIFGMNTTHPWILGIKHDFTIIIAIMAVSAIAVYFLLREKK